jgi:Mg2+ and Co2+ transporter CorA
MKKIISIVCILLTLSVSAQNRRPNPSGQFSPAEYAKQQREFFTKNAELTQEEADAFFPIYNELQQKKREINRQIRMTMRQEGGAQISEEQSLKAIDAKADANIRIAELEKEYLQKFKEVLPASKILKIQNAEEQFNSQILKDIQQSRGHQFQQGQQRPGQPQQQRPGIPQMQRSGN